MYVSKLLPLGVALRRFYSILWMPRSKNVHQVEHLFCSLILPLMAPQGQPLSGYDTPLSESSQAPEAGDKGTFSARPRKIPGKLG